MMAILSLHESLMDSIDIAEVLRNFCSSVEFIHFEGQAGIFRIQGEELPAEDLQVALILQKFEGVKPFVLGVDVGPIWQNKQEWLK